MHARLQDIDPPGDEVRVVDVAALGGDRSVYNGWDRRPACAAGIADHRTLRPPLSRTKGEACDGVTRHVENRDVALGVEEDDVSMHRCPVWLGDRVGRRA